MKVKFTYLLVTVLFWICLADISLAQDSTSTVKTRRIVQFSGLVVGGDSLYGIPGALLYVPEAGRGAISSSVGYFSMPVLEGDSVVIRCLTFKQKDFIIPPSPDGELSVIIELKEDTLLLPAIQILPWPTEQVFKEAFIALKLPQADVDNMHKNLNEQVMKRMLYTLDADGALNHKYYMEQQIVRQENKMSFISPWNSLLNPFAWQKFIQQIKNGEHKNKASEYTYENDESE